MVLFSGNEQGICSAYELMCTKLEAGEDGNQSKNLNLRYNHDHNNPIYTYNFNISLYHYILPITVQ